MAQTCGFPECVMPRSHGGDFHVGAPDPDDRRPMWPMAGRRAEAEAKVGVWEWPVYAKVAPAP